MKHNVTVEKALSRGQIIAVFIPLACIVATPLVSAVIFGPNAFSVIGGIIGGFLASWLAWSIGITYWRLWAFENVRNVHQLKKRAVEEKIIWRDGHFFERTEIRNAEQKEKLRLLEQRFSQDDIFYDDLSVPNATYIYFSKVNSYSEIIAGIGMLAAAVYFFIADDPEAKAKFLIYVGPIVGIVMIYKGINKLKIIKPQLVIDDEGFRIAGNGLIVWESIHDASVVTRNKEQFLEIHHFGGQEVVEIQKLGTNAKKLRHIIDIYRVRHAKNNTVSVN